MEQSDFDDLEYKLKQINKLLNRYHLQLGKSEAEIRQLLYGYFKAGETLLLDPVEKANKLVQLIDRSTKLIEVVEEELRLNLSGTPAQLELDQINIEIEKYTIDENYVQTHSNQYKDINNKIVELSIFYEIVSNELRWLYRIILQNKILKLASLLIFVIIFFLERILNKALNYHDGIVLSFVIAAGFAFPVIWFIQNEFIKPFFIKQLNKSVQILQRPIPGLDILGKK